MPDKPDLKVVDIAAKLLTCPVCEARKWKDMDFLRNQEYWRDAGKMSQKETLGFQVCTKCGYMTYAQTRSENQIKSYYKDEYRSIVTGGNVQTCITKNLYHKAFLDKEFTELQKKGGNALDFGCAQGASLDMLATDYKWDRKKLYGTEWTKGFRVFAKEEYDLNMSVDPDYSKKYDLIMCFRVLEHVQDPRDILLKLRGCLADNGRLYLSVPTWLGSIEDPGGNNTRDFENLFHKDHICVFTDTSIRNLLKLTGFEIVKETEALYGGFTVLLKKCAPSNKIKLEKADQVIDKVARVKKAIELLAVDDEPWEASLMWPRFPDAQIAKAYRKKNLRSEIVPKEVLENALHLMPNNFKLHVEMAMYHFRWNQHTQGGIRYTASIEKAQDWLEKALELKPGSQEILVRLGDVAANYKGDKKAAIKYWKQVMADNPGRSNEMWSYIGACHADEKFAIRVESPPSKAPKPKVKTGFTAEPKVARLGP